MNRFIKTILVSVLYLLLCVPVWAQDIEYGMTRKTYEIAGIEVEGADSYEDFVLIGFSGLAVGDKIEVPGDQITKAIRRFWKQGLFSSVKIKAKRIEDNKIWLVIALVQRPRVSEVRIEGLKKSEKEDVEVKMGIRQGSQMTPNLEDHAKTVIKKYLAEKGFHNAEVHIIQQNDVDHPGYVRVLVGVDKKVKTKVGKIYLTGNQALTDVDINKAMKKTNDHAIYSARNAFDLRRNIAAARIRKLQHGRLQNLPCDAQYERCDKNGTGGIDPVERREEMRYGNGRSDRQGADRVRPVMPGVSFRGR